MGRDDFSGVSACTGSAGTGIQKESQGGLRDLDHHPLLPRSLRLDTLRIKGQRFREPLSLDEYSNDYAMIRTMEAGK